MNDKEDRQLEHEADDAAQMIAELQDQVDALSAQLDDAHDDIAALEAQIAAGAAQPAAPAGNAEVQGLARTYRTAVRNGHPDAPKHLETLLNLLSA